MSAKSAPLTLVVRTPSGKYPVRLGAGALAGLPRLLAKPTRPSRLHLVSDDTVYGHHGARVEAVLRRAGFTLSRTVLPAGEASKSAAALVRIWRDAIRGGADRNACFLALGGGVVGDLAGFAAASFLRGVEFVQLPTTLLAMVDASVGGKTGINLPEGKNLVGAFHQPRAVVMDLDFLRTLPEREMRSGWAEVIKTAAILDRKLFADLGRARSDLVARRPMALAAVVAACVRTKARIVEEDERESGLRRILNFGHTLAHGIEAAQGYGGYLHGEAVAIGMVFAARLGENLRLTAPGTAERLEGLIRAYGLPASIDTSVARRLRARGGSRILSAMSRDKKRGPEGQRWVLLKRIGETVVTAAVPPETVREELLSFVASRERSDG
jgi:3-dehydroquinate synthase